MDKSKLATALRLVLLNAPYAAVALEGTKLGQAYRYAKIIQTYRVQNGLPDSPLTALMQGGTQAFSDWIPSLVPADMLVGLCCGVGFWLVVYTKKKNAKKYRHGVEHGSARW